MGQTQYKVDNSLSKTINKNNVRTEKTNEIVNIFTGNISYLLESLTPT
jgi:hypothetical protein